MSVGKAQLTIMAYNEIHWSSLMLLLSIGVARPLGMCPGELE